MTDSTNKMHCYKITVVEYSSNDQSSRRQNQSVKKPNRNRWKICTIRYRRSARNWNIAGSILLWLKAFVERETKEDEMVRSGDHLFPGVHMFCLKEHFINTV